jgi:DNA-binding MarR family transcriptional regulator
MDIDAVPHRLRSLPSFLLAQGSLRAGAAVREALAAEGLHRSQYSMLCSLDESGPQSQVELGERAGLDRSDVVRWVDDLETAGLVTRTKDPADRRRNVVAMTAAGRRRLGRLHKAVDSAQDSALATLSVAERDQLVRLLDKLAAD